MARSATRFTATGWCTERMAVALALIWDHLPLEARANLWGDEVYFAIPVSVGPEADARETVEVGDVGYWPSGNALCLYFGPTPASVDEKPRAASPVTVVGKIVEGLDSTKLVRSAERLRIEGVEEQKGCV